MKKKISDVNVLKILKNIKLHLDMKKPNGAIIHDIKTLQAKIYLEITDVNELSHQNCTFDELKKKKT